MTRRTPEASFLYTQTPDRPPLAAVTRIIITIPVIIIVAIIIDIIIIILILLLLS